MVNSCIEGRGRSHPCHRLSEGPPVKICSHPTNGTTRTSPWVCTQYIHNWPNTRTCACTHTHLQTYVLKIHGAGMAWCWCESQSSVSIRSARHQSLKHLHRHQRSSINCARLSLQRTLNARTLPCEMEQQNTTHLWMGIPGGLFDRAPVGYRKVLGLIPAVGGLPRPMTHQNGLAGSWVTFNYWVTILIV